MYDYVITTINAKKEIIDDICSKYLNNSRYILDFNKLISSKSDRVLLNKCSTDYFDNVKRISDTDISFHTPWSSEHPLFELLATKYPDNILNVKYEDEDKEWSTYESIKCNNQVIISEFEETKQVSTVLPNNEKYISLIFTDSNTIQKLDYICGDDDQTKSLEDISLSEQYVNDISNPVISQIKNLDDQMKTVDIDILSEIVNNTLNHNIVLKPIDCIKHNNFNQHEYSIFTNNFKPSLNNQKIYYSLGNCSGQVRKFIYENTDGQTLSFLERFKENNTVDVWQLNNLDYNTVSAFNFIKQFDERSQSNAISNKNNNTQSKRR